MKNIIQLSLLVVFLSIFSLSCQFGENGDDGANGVNGQDGINGSPGEDGKDGLSFNWLGEAAVFPSDPEKYDVFLNTVDGNSYIFDGESWAIFAYGASQDESEIDSMTDTRDNKKYVTVKIGNQVWLGANLDYRTKNSRCFNDSEMNCGKYGSMYTWTEALNGHDFDNGDPSIIKGICPDGWHLPSIGEWYRLLGVSGGTNSVYLRSTTDWDDPGYDRFGMNIRYGGYTVISSNDETKMGISQLSEFWTSSYPPKIEYQNEQSKDTHGGVIRVDDDKICQYYEDKRTQQYVRCIKNMP